MQIPGQFCVEMNSHDLLPASGHGTLAAGRSNCLEQGAKLRAAQTAGFAVARHGEEAIGAALDRLAAFAAGKSDKPHKAFGERFTKLSRGYVAEECFAPFRQLLRNKILTIWPIAAEEVLLAERLPERIFHSLLSASEEIGIGTPRLEQFLTEAGAIAVGNDRPQSRKLFDAKRYAPLLEGRCCASHALGMRAPFPFVIMARE